MHDLIIIGAGPAGLAAALYAGRFRINTLILEKMACGGQILFAPTIENYPGFPGGILTTELIDRFKGQIQELGLRVEDREALEIKPDSSKSPVVYQVRTEEVTYEAKSIIIATGAQPKRLGVKGEEKLTGRGVSYCATCDAPLFKNKGVVVVGGGDRAVEEALYLSAYANSVALIHRRDRFRASEILLEKAQKNPKINFILDSVVEEILGLNKTDGVRVRNLVTNAASEIKCQGVFVFVGIKPNTVFLKNLLEIDESGFIITDEKMQASQAGIFACGDCCKKSLYQVITACADGATSAASAHSYLLKFSGG